MQERREKRHGTRGRWGWCRWRVDCRLAPIHSPIVPPRGERAEIARFLHCNPPPPLDYRGFYNGCITEEDRTIKEPLSLREEEKQWGQQGWGPTSEGRSRREQRDPPVGKFGPFAQPAGLARKKKTCCYFLKAEIGGRYD
ncbi:hypothetical protein WN51_08319 [Melipona quadrifasciata]|uniref:Uncharacterized protein n=1 Tax=Melipona quadrifasciata TaxID=166423 RepID=A0A0M9ABY4_9HYME|nr:hypothetical protein WN51_08319 [Melipona quadrifasciata]